MCISECLGAPSGEPEGVFEASWGHFGLILGLLGRVLGRLRAVLEASWDVLGASRGHSGQNIEKRSSAIRFLDRFWMPKRKAKSLKMVFEKRNACHDVFFKSNFN